MHRQLALVRRPSPLLADGLVQGERRPLDTARALHQWQAYRQAFDDAGWQTVEAPPADDCPDGVFIEDAMVVYADLAVITRPGAAERRAEVPSAEVAVRSLGYRVARITGPATLDGGDVLKHDRTVWVGVGGRTNLAGASQLSELLHPLGARVVPVPVGPALHLKSAVTALPDGTVLTFPGLLADSAAFPRTLEVAEPEGAHVVLLNDGRLLMAASAPRTAEQLSALGHVVVAVDIGEFEKLDGCVTCLSVRLRNGW